MIPLKYKQWRSQDFRSRGAQKNQAGPPQIFFRRAFFLTTSPPPPPRRQKIFGQCTILGPKKNFSDIPKFFGTYYKFSSYHKISHVIYAISHKIVIICPIFLYNKPILPDCEANIARLALFAQQTGWSGANHA